MSTLTVNQRVICLCTDKNEPVYQEKLEGLPIEMICVPNVHQLMEELISRPPVTVLVDQETLVEHSPQEISWVHRFETSWPVLFAACDERQEYRVACQNPVNEGELRYALEMILNDHHEWRTDGPQRGFIRLDCMLRARYRANNASEWEIGTAINISSMGVFVVSYDPLPIGALVELELLDLNSKPMRCSAEVAWRRTWSQSNALPGIGLLLPEQEIGLWRALREARLTQSING